MFWAGKRQEKNRHIKEKTVLRNHPKMQKTALQPERGIQRNPKEQINFDKSRSVQGEPSRKKKVTKLSKKGEEMAFDSVLQEGIQCKTPVAKQKQGGEESIDPHVWEN